MKRTLPIFAIVACAVVFIFGVVQLFKVRFAIGDVYPPYSSLRSDPLGTMAFYESLEKMPGFTVRRDYSTANQLPDGKSTAYLHLAASRYEWERMPESMLKEIEQFVTGGGRLVITLSPEAASGYQSRWNSEKDSETNSVPPVKDSNDPEKSDDAPEKKSEPGKSKKKIPKSPEEEELEKHWVSIQARWGLSFKMINLEPGDDNRFEAAPVHNRTDLLLPETLQWHSGITCTHSNAAWQTIYARGTNAVVTERAFGRGSVVIATDSFFLSNEAMRDDRHPELLSWLIGGSRRVVFDEAHLGVMESPGVATLMRKYRLHWLTAGLLLLAGLFIWKNSTSLVPAHDDEQQRDYVVGRDASSGFVNLLRRSIATRDLLATCFAEWKRSARQSGKYSSTRLDQAEAVFQRENALPPKERHPLRTYQEIHSILETRKPENEP